MTKGHSVQIHRQRCKAHIQGLRDHQDVIVIEIKAKCDLWLQDPPGLVNGVRAL